MAKKTEPKNEDVAKSTRESVEAAPKKEQKQTWRFRSIGNVTIGLRSSYREVVYNDMGKPIMEKTIPPVRAVFHNGFFETSDEDIVLMLKETPNWANDIFFDPTSLPKDASDEDIDNANRVASAEFARKRRHTQAIENAKEGSVEKEQ